MTDIEQQRCGFISLIGAPNAGKSTLLNQIIGSKISIVSPKVQTTRTIIRGIHMMEDTQLVFLDTPGIFRKARHSLDKAMLRAAWDGSHDADIVLLLIDASVGLCKDTQDIIKILKREGQRVIVLLNKIDTISPPVLLKLADEVNQTEIVDQIFMISALSGDGVEDMLAHLKENAKLMPWMYPEDEITTAPWRFLAAEITREKLFLHLQQELPYAVAVETERWENFDNGSVKIHHVIYVHKDSQKRIIIGKNGSMIKKVRELAQKELQTLLECKVHLFLFVKVKENWENNPEYYTY